MENQKIPTKANKSQDLIYEMRKNERGKEIFIPLKISHNGYVHEGMVLFIVVLACPSSDPIRVPQRTLHPRVTHVQHTNDSSSSVQRDMVEW
jgi:hypothetical protein